MNMNCNDAPLIILPGLLCDGRMFAPQTDAFPRSSVINGFYGECDRIEAMADYALERMPERAAILGHSMGARVALEIWHKAPKRVERLALADTGFHGVKPGEAEKRYALRDKGRSEGFEALVDAWLPPMIGASNRSDPAVLQPLKAMCMAAGQACFERQIEALLHRPETENVTASLTCPVTLIVGEEDEWSTPQQHADMAARLGGAPVEIVPGAGHMAPFERPEAFDRAVKRWLEQGA